MKSEIVGSVLIALDEGQRALMIKDSAMETGHGKRMGDKGYHGRVEERETAEKIWGILGRWELIACVIVKGFGRGDSGYDRYSFFFFRRFVSDTTALPPLLAFLVITPQLPVSHGE